MTAQQMGGGPQQPPGQMGMGMGGGGPMDMLAAQAAGAAPGGMTSLNAPGEQAVMPPEGLTPGAPPPGGGPLTGPGYNSVQQTMVKEGEPTNRLLLQQPIGTPPPEGV
jgi:hypothetical protein